MCSERQFCRPKCPLTPRRTTPSDLKFNLGSDWEGMRLQIIGKGLSKKSVVNALCFLQNVQEGALNTLKNKWKKILEKVEN